MGMTSMGAGSAISEASSTSVPGSMRSPVSSFMRSPVDVSNNNSMMPSPVSSRLTMEFETAFLMEAEDPVRFSSTDILPYLSQASSSCSASSSDFDSDDGGDGGSRSTSSSSFCDFNDSNRITLASLIGLPMDSFRHFGESFRFRLLRGGSDHHHSARTSSSDNNTSTRIDVDSPRRSRTCSLLGDLFRCLQRTSRTDFNSAMPPATTLTSLTSFTITEVSEADENDDSDAHVPTVFDNSVFVDRDTLGSRIYEFNPLFNISDATSEADDMSRDLSLPRAADTSGDSEIRAKYPNIITNPTDHVESPRLSVRVSSSASPICRSQPLSPMRAVLTTVCCQLGDDSDVEYTSDHDHD